MKKIFGSGPTTAKPPSGDSNDLRISGASIDTKKYVPPGYQIRDRDLRKIHRAASEGKVAKVQQILLLGENGLNDTDKRKRTALHLACANGHAEVVTLLVERKCQLNLCDDENRTALMKAVQGQKEQCAVILLKHGADPNLKDICGNTALHYAVCDENISIVKKLLSHNADIEATNKDNFTPLLLAINANQQEMVEFLVKKKANVHAVDKIKRTTLMLALRNGSTNMVRHLLGKGVDVCCRDHYGWTAHDYARINGSVPNIQLVIQYEQKQMCKNSSQNYPENKSAEDDSLSSISSLSNKPGPGDPWPSSEDSNLELGVKNIPKPDLSKPISLAQQYRKFLEEKYGIVKPENKPMCEDNNFDGNREDETHPEPSLKKGATEPKVGNGEKGVMPASEFEKEHTESPWELESVSESVSLKCVGPLPEATGEKGEKMLNGHVADSAEKSPHFKSIEPTIEIKDSVADQAFRRKDVQTSISGVMPASELEKEDTRSPWDTESISESITLKCLGPLPEPTDEKREKMLNGHVADSAEKSPHLKPTEPTFEIKDSAADKALGRKDVHTSRSERGLKMYPEEPKTRDESKTKMNLPQVSEKRKTYKDILLKIPKCTNDVAAAEDDADGLIRQRKNGNTDNWQSLIKEKVDSDSSAIDMKKMKKSKFKKRTWNLSAVAPVPVLEKADLPTGVPQVDDDGTWIQVGQDEGRPTKKVPDKNSKVPNQRNSKDGTDNSPQTSLIILKDCASPNSNHKNSTLLNEQLGMDCKDLSSEIELEMYPEQQETPDESESRQSQVSDKKKSFKSLLSKISKCMYDDAVEDNADGLLPQRKSENTDNWLSLTKEKVDSVSNSSAIHMKKWKKCKYKKRTSKESPVTPVLDKADSSTGVPQVDDDGTRSQVGQDEGRPTKKVPDKNSKVQKQMNSKDDPDNSPHSSLTILKDCASPNSYLKKSMLLNEQLGIDCKDFSSETELKMYPEEHKTPDESETRQSQVSDKRKSFKGLLSKISKCMCHAAAEDDADGLIRQRKSGNTDNWQSLIKEKVDSVSSAIQKRKVKKYKCEKRTSKESAVIAVLEKTDLPTGVPQVDDDGTRIQVGQDEGRPTKKVPDKNSKVQNQMNSKDDPDNSPQSSLTVLKDCTLPNSNLNEQRGMDCTDYLSLWKIKDTLLSFERLLQLKTNHCNQLKRKNKEMKNEISRLQKELSETKEMKSQLEHQKVEWEQELCSLRSTLKDEQERRRSTDGLYENIRDKLRRRKEQYKKQREVKRELELSVRTLDTELKTVKNQLNQVTNSHGEEEDLLNKIHMLQDEIAMLKVEVNTLQKQNQEKEKKYSEDIAVIKEKNDDLQKTIKQSEEILKETVSQYRGKINVLKTEKAMLTEKNDDLQKTIKQSEEILKETVSHYRGKINVLRTANSMLREKNDHLQKTIREIDEILRETVSQYRGKLKILKTEKAMLTEKNDDLQKTIKQSEEILKETVSHYRGKINVLRTENSILIEKNDHLQKTIKQNEEILTETISQYRGKFKVLKTEKAMLTEKNDALQKTIKQSEEILKETVSHYRGKINVLRTENSMLTEKNDDLQKTVRQNVNIPTETVSQYCGKLNVLRTENSMLTEKNDDLQKTD